MDLGARGPRRLAQRPRRRGLFDAGLYFAGWALGRPAWRWWGLAIGILAGAGFSVVRILQGAHFLSQTLWSAALLWFLAAVFFSPLIAARPGGLSAGLRGPDSVGDAKGGKRA